MKNRKTGERYRLSDKISSKWRMIGTLLGIEDDLLDSIDMDHGYNDKKLRRVLGKWFENAGQMNNRDEYPLTWKGLKILLEDIEKAEIAKEYFDFLKRASE